MNEQIKRKWIKALRSGKYKQGTDFLYFQGDDTYCCLGVLGCVETGRKGEHHPSDNLLSMDDWRAFVDLNDSGATFEQIALCIENGL